MNARLAKIQDWPELARQVNWSVAKMAKQCGVSVRTLHRHFLDYMGKSTKAWLAEQRQHNAIELLCDGSSIKETATCLGYKQQGSLTRIYKKHFGICPSEHQPKCPPQRQVVRKG